MALIAKNTTANDITMTSLAVPNSIIPKSPGQENLLASNHWSEIQSDVQLKDLVAAGDIIINDGTTDLTQEAALGILAEPINRPTKDGVPVISLDGEQSDKALRVAHVGRIGSEVIYATHNFSDKTTWYSESLRVTDEALTDSGDGLLWNSTNTDWIDMVHGKIMDEEAIRLENEPTHEYLVVVKVDSVEKTQRTPYVSSGGDYSVDFATGTITFFSSQAGKTVEASYSHENGSTWIMRPSTGMKLTIEDAEAQFSADVVVNDTIKFAAWGVADVFAPQLVPSPLPSGTLIELPPNTRYMRLDQIIDEARGAYPEIPALGGATRGNLKARFGFPFRYGAVKTLSSAALMELRVTLEGNLVFGGERTTATFYCSSETES